MPPAARITDMHTCPVPTHVGGPVVLGDVTVLIGYMPAARVGDNLICATGPDSIARGESTVLIGSSAQVEALKTEKPFCEECEKKRQQRLMLEHRYHDDDPVQGAEYEVELRDGTIIKGKLDDDGRAEIEGVPAEKARVRFGPDKRKWERKDQAPNPQHKASFGDADADALLDAVLGGGR